MINGLNFSIGDRINAAKAATTNKTNIEQVPSTVRAPPGPSKLNLDTQSLDQAGQSVYKEQTDAQTATDKSAQKQYTSETNNITYNKPISPEYPAEKDPGQVVPKPINKTFTQRLLDNQIQSSLNKDTQPGNLQTEPAQYPTRQADDINKPRPVSNTPSRPKPGGFDPGNITSPNSTLPQGDPTSHIPMGRPAVNLGPQYSGPGNFKPLNIKSIPKPKLRP